MVSLGLISETGDGAPRDLQLAYSLYERAAEGGSPDGAINLAVALVRGAGIERDVGRAEDLLRTASAGRLCDRHLQSRRVGAGGPRGDEGGCAYFARAADLGEPRAYVAAAILLDEGRGVEKDAGAAAEMLLRGAASDYGEAITQLTARRGTGRRIPSRPCRRGFGPLGFYGGAIDGISGPMLREALTLWRNGGIVKASDRL